MSIPRHLILFVVATALTPLALLVGLLIDIVRYARRRTPFMAVRLFFFGWYYLAVGTVCLLVLLVQWLGAGFGRDRLRMRRGSYRLQRWWARQLLGAVAWLFKITIRIEGLDVITPGPILVLMRHASIIDTLLPNVVVTGMAGINLHYVLKKELLADPALDIAGNRLVNHFVDRDGDSRAEIEAVVALADGLTAEEGVLIYPEGTRFTEARRQRILDGMGTRESELTRRSRGLKWVLPPRPGGTGALLGLGMDVIIGAHTGLEPLATIPDVWSGRIVGATLDIRFTRHPASGVPDSRSGRVSWLFDRWEEIDAWIASKRS